jgi:hypothetical protein
MPPIKGPRKLGLIKIPPLTGVTGDPPKPAFNTATEALKQVQVYWKRGVIEWFGTSVEAFDVLNYTGYKHLTMFQAVKKDGVDGDAATDFEVKEVAKKLSKMPSGSIRQKSIRLILSNDTQIEEYDGSESIGTKAFKSISLSYNTKYKIHTIEWINWLANNSGKSASIEAMVTPDGESIQIPTQAGATPTNPKD